MNVAITDFADQEVSVDDAFDLMIFAVTGETRGWHLPELFRKSAAPAWVLRRQNQFSDADRLDLEIETRLKGFSLIREASFGDSLGHFFSGLDSPSVRVLIDVTCMPRVDMAWVVGELVAEASKASKSLEVVFGYVLAQYSPPLEELAANESIKPVSARFAGWPDDATGPTSLIVGLGYEPGKASGACEFFDATDPWVFAPVSPIQAFDEAVQENNRAVVDRARRAGRYIPYPVISPADALSRLLILVGDHLAKANPVILPFGPKIFFALSLAAAVNFPAVGVWHMTGDHDLPGRDHKASGVIIGLMVRFSAVSKTTTGG